MAKYSGIRSLYLNTHNIGHYLFFSEWEVAGIRYRNLGSLSPTPTPLPGGEDTLAWAACLPSQKSDRTQLSKIL